MIVIDKVTFDCGTWYEVKVEGVVVACCGTLHFARKIAENERKKILEKLIKGC